jgi:hypothetical protein
MNLSWIKKVYLYLVSLISLIILVIAGIILINLALKTWVFPKADENYYSSPLAQCEGAPKPADGQQTVDNNCLPENIATQEKLAKEDRKSQKQRDASQALAMIIVATPVFLYHWKLARKEA